jgi:2-polyprenyl-6-methoxyphenol hydroxylase-like FAD-dependent oxidoreductase
VRGHAIAIAGCGPGGLASALFLHRLGHRVTLYERFDEPQPVGSGLLVQPSGLSILGELGVDAPIRGQGARIDFLKGTSVLSGKRALDVRYGALKGGQCAYGVHRSLLFGTLYDTVRAEGIAIETGHSVTGCDDGRFTFADGTASPRFDCLVDALGARTPLPPPSGRYLDYGALWATLDWPEGTSLPADALDQRYRRAREMAGVMPIGTNPATGKPGAAFFWSVRADKLDALHTGGTEAWKAQVLALWPETKALLPQIADTRDMVFAHYAHRTVRRPVVPGLARPLVHLGDAWHSTSPQLGQGANMALLDAAALGVAFARHPDIADALAHYAWLRSAHIRLYQAMSRVFTPLYQADDRLRPFLRDRLVHHFAGLWPARRLVAAIVSGNLGWPLRPMGFGSPC